MSDPLRDHELRKIGIPFLKMERIFLTGDPNKIELTPSEGRNRVTKGKGVLGSFRVMLALSILVGIVVPISMLKDFPEATKWKTFIIMGVLSFASFWAIACISWIIVAIMVKKSKHKSNS
jgi:hypothetical protein